MKAAFAAFFFSVCLPDFVQSSDQRCRTFIRVDHLVGANHAINSVVAGYGNQGTIRAILANQFG
jgi:hypothetical protein